MNILYLKEHEVEPLASVAEVIELQRLGGPI